MKKILVLIVVLILSRLSVAQVEIEKGEKPSILDRMYVGGGFSASFGSITSIYVSPTVGYMITRSLSAGVGVTYNYYRNDFIDYQTNIYGFKLFARQNFRLLRLPLFAYSEFETLNWERYVQLPSGEYQFRREWQPAMFVGGGFFQSFGRRGGFYIIAMYNLIYREPSFYNSPWVFRVGFTL